RGRLAVGSGGPDHGPLLGDHLEELRAPPHRQAGAARRLQLRVAVGDRRRSYDEIGLAYSFGTAPFPHLDPERRQEVGRRSGSQVRAADAVAAAGEDLGQGAHAGAADTDDVDALGEIGHVDAISIKAWAMTVAAWGLAIFLAASAIRLRASESDIRASTFGASSWMRSSVTTTAAPASARAAALRA